MEKSNQPPFSDEKVVSTSCKVDMIDVLLNGIAALATGSVVMLAETLQGVSDLIVDGLTYVGMKRSKRLPTKNILWVLAVSFTSGLFFPRWSCS